MTLSRAFLEATPGAEAAPDLEERLLSACALGRAAHPALTVSDEAFARHLGRCLARAEGAPPSFEELQVEDLFLATACLEQVPGAAEAFNAHCGERLRAALAATVKAEDARREVAQRVREAVLVGTAEAGPKIAGYSGQGPLERWVAIVAQRMAITLVRGETAARQAHERASLERAFSMQEPEVAFVKEQYRADFQRAFSEALAILDERERMLMRLHIVSGVSVEAIGKMYGVSQSTASRWLAAARERISAEVVRLLQERLNLALSEIGSLAKLVASQLDLNMSRVL